MFDFSDGWLAARLLFILPVLLALTVHEFAHAWTAYQLGDDTAAREGRLTLNPLEHIDPVGLLLPLMGVPFGWAKPVPINPGKFSSRVSLGTGLVLTAGAGPLSNVLLAAATTLGMGAWVATDPSAAAGGALWSHLELFVVINVMLAVFNLIPLPPLDGGRIADAVMPREWRPSWDAIAWLGPVGIALVIIVPAFLGIDLLGWPVARTREVVDAVVMLASG